jgi:hypothetical protein
VAFLLYLLIKAYNERRPGALSWALWLTVCTAVVTWTSLWFARPSAEFGLETLWLRVWEVLYWELMLAWTIFWLTLVANHFAGWWAVRSLKANPVTDGALSPEAQFDHASRSRWTGRLMLSLPSLLFLVVSLTVWGLVALLALKYLPCQVYSSWVRLNGGGCFSGFVTAIFNWQFKAVLPTILVGMGVAALPAVWGLAPVVWNEVRPPEPKVALDHRSNHDRSHARGYLAD